MVDKEVEELNQLSPLFCRGDVVQVDTWVCASGKNGMRRDWLVRDCKTGETLTRASRYRFPLPASNPCFFSRSLNSLGSCLHLKRRKE